MISAPMPTLLRAANESSIPTPPPSPQKRVPNIQSWRRSPACPKGASSDCGSPAPKPSREIEKLWTRVSDIVELLRTGMVERCCGLAGRDECGAQPDHHDATG